MAYEISSSVANGTFLFQHVTASNAVDFNNASEKTYPNSGQPSPNGDKIAAFTRFAGGATGQTGQNFGIDIYHSSSGGWSRQETIQTVGIPSIIQWRTQSELWYYGEDISGSTTTDMLWYRTSGSSGWSDAKMGAGFSNGFGRLDNPSYFIFNQQKDLIIAWEGQISGQDETRWAMYYSGSQTSTKDGMWDGIRFKRSGQFMEYGVTQCVPGPRSADKQTLFLSDETNGRVWSHEVDLSGWSTPDGSETSVTTIGSDFTALLQQASFPTDFPWITDNWASLPNQSNGKQVNKSESFFAGLLYWHSASNNILVQSSPGASTGTSSEAWSAFNGSSNFKLYLYTSGSTGWFHNEEEILSDEVKPFAVTQTQGLQPGYDENRIFYGTNGLSRTPTTAWRGSINCLESGSEGWKITKGIHYPMIGGNFVGYSNTLLVANTPQQNLTNPVSQQSHVLGTINDMHNATFSVAALPSVIPPPAVVVTPGSITVSETGTTANVVITLSQDPGPNTVDVNVSGLDSTEVAVDQTIQILSTSNWNTGVTFVFTGQDDLIDDGNQTFSVAFTTTCSGDASFDGLTGALSVTVEDNDTAGFTINPSSPMEITEGSTGTISVVLNSQPTSNVVIDVSAAAGWNSRASVSPSQLTFTNLNWNTSSNVTITTVNDNQVNGDETDTVTFTVNDSSTSDVNFQALSDQTISVTVKDNDTAAFSLIPGSVISVTEAGASSTLSVRLASAPTQNVTASLSGLDATEVSVSPSAGELTFTPSNWNTTQDFIFTGVNDDIADGNQTFTVTLTAASGDSNFNGITSGITITNVDDDVDTPAAPKESTTKTGTTKVGDTIKQGTTEVAKTIADYLPRKMHFEPSTIVNIDRSVLSYLTKLNLFADTNDGWRKVPIVWGTAERAYQVKHNEDIRDQQGMLKLPLISIKRTSLSKDMPSKGVFQGTSPAYDDEQGGSLAVGRMIYQDKTTKFANADAARLHSQRNYPRYNSKIVYRTVSAPMPVNVTVMYEITIRTEYQQQMNHLVLPFITMPGTINYVRLFDGEHRYEAFVQGDMQNNDNLADYSSDERKFETKIQLKVIGYLIGEENNREKPHYAIRENAVEIKIPRERISLAEIPEMEYGRYYGLEGVPPEQLKDPSPFFTRNRKDPKLPFFFSNVPAVGAGLAADIVAGGSSSSTTDVSTNLITRGNFSETLADNMVVRELLKADNTAPPSPANQLVATIATIRANTESVFVNGMIQALGSGNDYTISGNTITFTYDLTEEDSVYVTYIKG